MSSNVSYDLLSHLLATAGGAKRRKPKRNAPKKQRAAPRSSAPRKKAMRGKALPAIAASLLMPLVGKLVSHIASKVAETPFVRSLRSKVGLGIRKRYATTRAPAMRASGYVLAGRAAPAPKKRASPFVDSRRRGLVPF